jgi:hypothetical protein
MHVGLQAREAIRAGFHVIRMLAARVMRSYARYLASREALVLPQRVPRSCCRCTAAVSRCCCVAQGRLLNTVPLLP